MTTNDMDRIESRALFYKLMARAFSYPSEEMIGATTRDEYWQDLDQLFNCVDPAGTIAAITKEAESDVRREAEAGLLELEVEYNRLFQVAKDIPCPLTASEYLKGESRQAVAVAQLSGLYKRFGVKMKSLKEPDHLTALLEFMSWLCAKEARAAEQDNQENRQTCVKAQSILLEDYLGWVPLLQAGLKANANLRHYVWLAECLVEFMKLERKDLLTMAGTGV